MFPGPNARIFRNDAGEPIGWDYPTDDDPGDIIDAMDERYWRDGYGDDDVDDD